MIQLLCPLGPFTNLSKLETVPAGVNTETYHGSFAVRVVITLFNGLAIYNSLEIFILVFMTFTRYRGAYFWSLLIAAFGIIPHALGNILRFLALLPYSEQNIAIGMSVAGWYLMVTGQSFVLWSRLHLLLNGPCRDQILQWTKWMIILFALFLFIPTTVLGVSANHGNLVYAHGYTVMEKIQVSGFFLQELILSSTYMCQAIRLLRTSLNRRSRSIMYQLFVINVLIILLDIVLLVCEAANLFVLQVTLKPCIYSLKLKLEFAILSRLVEAVNGPTGSPDRPSRRSSMVAFVNEKGRRGSRRTEDDISEFVDVERMSSDVTHALPQGGSGQRRLVMLHDTMSDTDLIAPRVGVTFKDVDMNALKADAEEGFHGYGSAKVGDEELKQANEKESQIANNI